MTAATEFIWPIRVYYEDTDASGVAYHANYLKWFERGRTEWLRAKGYSQERLRLELGVAFTVAGLEVRYLKPARLDDELEVVTVIAEQRKASLRFAQSLRRRLSPDAVLATVEVRAGCVDALSFKPVPLPTLD